VFIICIYLLTVFILQLTFTLSYEGCNVFTTSFFHSLYECSRCIIPIEAEMGSLSFLFFSADRLISASLLFEWFVYGYTRLSGVIDCVAESKLELLGRRVGHVAEGV
jgi:hypothetical protein